jgi:hypothetical protein
MNVGGYRYRGEDDDPGLDDADEGWTERRPADAVRAPARADLLVGVGREAGQNQREDAAREAAQRQRHGGSVPAETSTVGGTPPQRGRSPARRTPPKAGGHSRGRSPDVQGRRDARGRSPAHSPRSNDRPAPLHRGSGFGGGGWVSEYGRVSDPRARWSPTRRGWGAADARAKMNLLKPWRKEVERFKPHSSLRVIGDLSTRPYTYGCRRDLPHNRQVTADADGDVYQRAKRTTAAAATQISMGDDDCSGGIRSPVKPALLTEWVRYWNTDYP